jgi:hypothetical protein
MTVYINLLSQPGRLEERKVKKKIKFEKEEN